MNEDRKKALDRFIDDLNNAIVIEPTGLSLSMGQCIERYDLLTAIRAALTAYEAMQWQPIETAPRDGTEVLIWNGTNCDVAHAAWFNDDGSPNWFNNDTTVEPTHWMPLSTPPQGGEE